jgi:hypothetical protein
VLSYAIRQKIWLNLSVIVDDEDNIVDTVGMALEPAVPVIECTSPPPAPAAPQHRDFRSQLLNSFCTSIFRPVVQQDQVPRLVGLRCQMSNKRFL